MSILKVAASALLLCISVSSFAMKAKSSASITGNLSIDLPLNTNLLLPSAKNPDPMLALGGGLTHNSADCPFKSRMAKGDDSNGKIISGKSRPLQTAHNDTGNR